MNIDPVARSQPDYASLPSEGDKAGMLSDASHPLAKAFNTEDSKCGGCQGQDYEALRDAGLDIRQEDRPMMSELLSAVAGSDSAGGAGLDPQKVDALFKAMDELGMLKDGKLTNDELKTLLEYVQNPASAPEPVRALLQGDQADSGMQSNAGTGCGGAGGSCGAGRPTAAGMAEEEDAPNGVGGAAAGGKAGKTSSPSGTNAAAAGGKTDKASAPSGASEAAGGGKADKKSEPSDAGEARRAARQSGESESEKAGAARRAARDGGDNTPSVSAGGEGASTEVGKVGNTSRPGQQTALAPGADAPTAPADTAPAQSATGASGKTTSPESDKDAGRTSGDGAASAQPAAPSQSATTQTDATDTGMTRKPDVNQFSTIDPGQGPQMTVDKNGKFVFNKVVDDSFLPPKVRAEMKQAVHENMDLDFFKSTFNNEADAYQYMVHMANLESARGSTLENGADAQGTGGGSAGYMHLHTTFGLEKQSWGSPLNTEGWSKSDVLSDYNKYTTLVMRSLDNNFKQVGGTPTQDDVAGAMSLWWTGKDSAQAGNYYLSALSGGTGVNHNTGSIYA